MNIIFLNLLDDIISRNFGIFFRDILFSLLKIEGKKNIVIPISLNEKLLFTYSPYTKLNLKFKSEPEKTPYTLGFELKIQP